MNLSTLLLLLLSFFLTVGCSNAGFDTANDASFRSVANGETVELVEDQDNPNLEDTLNENDGGDDLNGDDNNNNDGGQGNNNNNNDNGDDDDDDDDDDDGDYGWPWNWGHNNDRDGGNGHGGHGDRGDDGGKHGDRGDRGGKHGDGKSCLERLFEYFVDGDDDRLVTSPTEIEIDDELYNSIRCDEGGAAKSVWICKKPSGDKDGVSKCMPVNTLHDYLDTQNYGRGITASHHRSERDESRDEEEGEGDEGRSERRGGERDLNYIGRCKDDLEEESEPEVEDDTGFEEGFKD